MHHALISSAIELLYETGGEAALYVCKASARAADVTSTAKKITDALQTRPLGVISVQQ
jgi:hypothetical protein